MELTTVVEHCKATSESPLGKYSLYINIHNMQTHCPRGVAENIRQEALGKTALLLGLTFLSGFSTKLFPLLDLQEN